MSEKIEIPLNTVEIPGHPDEHGFTSEELERQGYVNPEEHPLHVANVEGRLNQAAAAEQAKRDKAMAQAMHLTRQEVALLGYGEVRIERNTEPTQYVVHRGQVMTRREADELRSKRSHGVAGNK